ncbi:hypothetical protein [Streptomyces anulatus]|uniref:hypothetical protein n=1 Tax=Streptomyces anulatus TaxID=1892 RepID=UPI003432DBB9
MLDDHGLLRTAHHDGGRLPGGRRRPLVLDLRGEVEDEVDGHAGPRPYERVPEFDDEPVFQVGRAAAAAGGLAVLAGLVTEVSPAG